VGAQKRGERNLMKKHLLSVFLLAAQLTIGACTKRPGTASLKPGSPQRISSTEANASEPAIVASDGTVYVVWVEHRGKEADVMLERFNNEGQTLGAAIRVNPQAGQATAWRGDQPTIAVAPDRTVYVGWTGRADPSSGSSPDIYLSASRDGGKSFYAPVKVNDDPKPTDHGMHSLAVAADGRVYVAWLDERNVAAMKDLAPMKEMKMKASSSGDDMESNREVFLSTSADGGRSFSPNQRIAGEVCPCCKTSLAVGKDGRVYVSWRQVLPGDYRHIAVSSSSDQGKTFAAPTIVSNDEWVLKGCPVSGAALSAEADGTLRVLWYAGGDKGQRGIYRSESRDGGKTFSSRKLLAASSAHGTPVLLRDHAAGVWQDGEGSQAQILGVRFRNDETVGSVKPGSPATAAPTTFGAGELPAVAATSDRVFIVYVAQNSDKQSIWLMTLEGKGSSTSF
jgi:hypothetical protein